MFRAFCRLYRPDHEQQHDCHHDTKVKPEAATSVIELLMMGGEKPETCWAVNKSQDNKLLRKLLHLVGDLFELFDGKFQRKSQQFASDAQLFFS